MLLRGIGIGLSLVIETDNARNHLIWVPKPQQNATALRLFRDGMEEMHEALWSGTREGWRMRMAGRTISVQLRKLLLDGAPLVHRVLHRPRFHPLRNKEGLGGDVYGNTRKLSIAPGTRDGRAPIRSLAASHTWGIEVYPLRGLRYEGGRQKWHLEPLFDLDGQPLALQTWLRLGLFRVNGREYSLMTTLKHLSNTEGAHVDIDKDPETRDMERVHFGHVTYPHLVAMLVGCYLLEQYKTAVAGDEGRWSAFTSPGGPSPAEYNVIRDGYFAGEIEPMGFEGEFHETGIPIPTHGERWSPVRFEERVRVEA